MPDRQSRGGDPFCHMQYKPFQIRKHHSAYDTALISCRINTDEAVSVISIVILPVRRIMAAGSFMGTSAESFGNGSSTNVV